MCLKRLPNLDWNGEDDRRNEISPVIKIDPKLFARLEQLEGNKFPSTERVVCNKGTPKWKEPPLLKREPSPNTKESGGTLKTQPDTVSGGNSPVTRKSIPQFPVMQSPFACFLQTEKEQEDDFDKYLQSPEIPSPEQPVHLAPITNFQISQFGPKIVQKDYGSETQSRERPEETNRIVSCKSQQHFEPLKVEAQTIRLLSPQFDSKKDQLKLNQHPFVKDNCLKHEHYLQKEELDSKKQPIIQADQGQPIRNCNWFVEPSFQFPQNLKIASSNAVTPTTKRDDRVYKPLFSFQDHCQIAIPGLAQRGHQELIPPNQTHLAPLVPSCPEFAIGRLQSAAPAPIRIYSERREQPDFQRSPVSFGQHFQNINTQLSPSAGYQSKNLLSPLKIVHGNSDHGNCHFDGFGLRTTRTFYDFSVTDRI